MIGAAEEGEAYGSFQSKLSMCCHEDGLVEVVVVVGGRSLKWMRCESAQSLWGAERGKN